MHGSLEGSVRVACAAAGVNYGSTQGHLCCCRSELWEHTANLERSVRVACAAAGVNYGSLEGSVRVTCAAAGVNYGSTQPALRGQSGSPVLLQE